MKSKFPEYQRDKFKWNMGKIDQKVQKERYTPIYREDAGIINGRLMTEEEFKEKWNKEFKEGISSFPDLQFTE